MAEEKVGVAGCAEVADVDIFDAKAGGEELGAIGFAEIEVHVFGRGLVAGRPHVEPLEGIGFFTRAGLVEVVGGIGELGGEVGDKVGGDFIAARTDGRTDGSEKLGWDAAKFELHAANGFLGNTGESAAPAGVNAGDSTILGIDDDNGNAIGGLDGEEKTGPIGGGGIAFAGIRWSLKKSVDHVRVKLFEGNETEIGGTEGGLKFAAILENVFARIPFHETEVEDFFINEGTDAAETGAEPVHEPRQSSKRREFEDL